MKDRSRWPFIVAGLITGAAAASAQPFAGFTQGNLVVSRSVYTGDINTLAVGQPLPPVCPSTAACGTGKASDNGLYPSTTYTNNVWNNNKIDGSFGITSPIFLDQVTPSGNLVTTLAIPTSAVNTSFSSKSELALNLSSDATALTFMAYVAPLNAIDVSNSNTPTVYDPTNPAGGSYYRAVVQAGANGSVMVTPTNAYSGNNGRAAMLGSTGYYYLAGNSNNGSGTPTNVINATGAELATPGQAASTPPTMIGNFSISQVNDPSTGAPYAPDKAGKDNNFRGLTIFNNTLYVTKGSGGNGINTVYQVGNLGTLPTPATAAATPITILPGFPVTLAKDTTTAMYPFGIWFANSTTLYVADEGDGTSANAASSKTAGLQKWAFTNGKWQMLYVLQNGLNLGQQYSVNGYPTAINPATDGLRNITGKVNGDGTVTIWGITSTVSANGDQGADPNKLVSITDTLANTDPSVGATEKFTTLRTANWGEVLRGVAFAPSGGNPVSTPLIGNVANPGGTSVAPGSLATADGANLAAGSPGPILGLFPTIFGGTSVSIVDAAGKTTAAPLYYVSPTEVGFYIPTGVAAGTARVSVTSNAVTQTGNVQIANVAPGLFTINSSGLAAAYVLRVSGTNLNYESVYSLSGSGGIVAAPIDMGASNDTVYLSLYGTGIQGAGASGVKVTINGINAPVTFAGPQGLTPGLDQINVQIPQSLARKGNVNVQLTAGGVAANPVQITIQ